VVPVLRVRQREPFVLHARLSSTSLSEAGKLDVHWKLYQCSERAGCDRFREAVDEYVNCRRSNRARSASDPSLTPLCLEPLEAYDRVAVTMLPDRALPWLHWENAASPRLTVDIPGEYVLVASARGDLAGAQSVSVEPPFNTLTLSAAPAYKADGYDAFILVGYDRAFTLWFFGLLSAGLQWGVRLGAPRDPWPPFGIRGHIAPTLTTRHHFTTEWIGELGLAPLGVLYQFHPEDGYVLHPGGMLSLGVVWRPTWIPFFSARAGVMGVTELANFNHSEVYGPLLGLGAEF
jgi:hypothetical protein